MPVTLEKSLALTIRRCRVARQWSQGDLCRKAGCGLKTVVEMEHYRQIPRLATIAEFAGALGMTASALIHLAEQLLPAYEEEEKRDAALTEICMQASGKANKRKANR